MDRSTTHNQYWRWLAVAFLLALTGLRFVHLDNDPPLYYAHITQSLLTDPYHLTFYARNAVLFDNWNPFDFHRFDVFRNSLISGLAYLSFSTFGVSAITANLAALAANLAGILLFLFGLGGGRPLREIFFTALFLLSSSYLFFYGRLPFLENGLILLAGLLFFVMMRCYARWWGQLLVGVLIALAALAGKLFGATLLGPVVLALVYLYRRHSVRPVVLTLLGCVVGAGLYLLIFYGGNFALLRSYYIEQSLDLYGPPPALRSIAALAAYFVTYPKEAGLWHFEPFLVALSCIGFVIAITDIDISKPDRRGLTLVFSACWLICGTLSLMIFAYRPIRYALFLFLPAAFLAASAVEHALRGDWTFKNRYRWLALPLVLACSWYVITQTVLLFIDDWRTVVFGNYLVWITLGASLAVTWGGYLFLARYQGPSRRLAILIPIAALALLVIYRQGDLITEGLSEPGRALHRYSRELATVVGPGAVLTGPYMPALTIDNGLPGLIYNFDLANIDPALFSKYPVTHILTTSAGWSSAVREFPTLTGAQLITQMAVREQIIGLYRVPHARVPATEFEIGSIALHSNDWQKALPHLRTFVTDHPESLLGNLQLAMALYAGERYQECVNILELVDRFYPNNDMANEFAREFYTRMYHRLGNEEYRKRAEYHARRVRELNPYAPSAQKE